MSRYPALLLAAAAVVSLNPLGAELPPAPKDAPLGKPKSTPPSQTKKTEPFTNRFGMTFAPIPAGTFTMGSPSKEVETPEKGKQVVPSGEAWPEELPQVEVRIGEAFFIGTTEVTQAQWKAATGLEPWMESEPFLRLGSDHPAVFVSATDIQVLLDKLNAADKDHIYRLPSEAEWEYASRAGATGERYGEPDAIAWYIENTTRVGKKYIHPVGKKQPNAWGLYDTLGNVWEWTADVYTSDLKGRKDATPNSVGDASRRTIRGGSYRHDASRARFAARNHADPALQLGDIGVRLVAVPRKK